MSLRPQHAYFYGYTASRIIAKMEIDQGDQCEVEQGSER